MADRKYCRGCLRDDEQNEAEAWCSDCSEEVCRPCAKVHKRFKPPHKVIPLDQVSDLSSSVLHMTKYCDVHTEQKIILFCTQHDKVICDLCLSDKHTDCKSVMSIERAAKGVKQGTALEDLQRRMTNLSSILQSILKSKTENMFSHDRQKDNILHQISAIRQKIDKHLDKIENEIKEDLNEKYSMCKENMKENKNDLERRSKDLQMWINDVSSLKTSTNEIQFFQALKVLDAKTHKEENEIQKLSKASQIELHPNDNITKISTIFQSIGQILMDEKETTIISQDKLHQVQVPKGQEKIGKTAMNSKSDGDPHDEKKSSNKVQHVYSIQSSIFGSGIKVQRACFIPSEKVLLVLCNKPYLYMCKVDGTGVEVIKLDHKPYDVAMIDSKQAIVALGTEGYQILDLTTLTLWKPIEPEGYACFKLYCSNGQIWVRGKSCIIHIEKSGKVLNTVTTIDDPRQHCLDDSGNIYCTTVDNNSVHLITAGGQERTFYSNSDLSVPTGIDVDGSGNVYVVGFRSGNMHKISPDGQTHDIILTKDDGIYCPDCICINSETDELLIINDEKQVDIYKLY